MVTRGCRIIEESGEEGGTFVDCPGVLAMYAAGPDALNQHDTPLPTLLIHTSFLFGEGWVAIWTGWDAGNCEQKVNPT